MMLIGILPVFTLIISGIIYFGVKVLERLLNKSIMGYVILLLIIAFIGIYGLLYFQKMMDVVEEQYFYFYLPLQ